MNVLRITFVCFLLFGNNAGVAADDAGSREGEFAGKVLVIELAGRDGSYTLENASLQTIGDRTFLVGSTPSKVDQQKKAKPTIAIAWEKVDVLTIFESMEAFRGPKKLSAPIDFPVTVEIARLRRNLASLNSETRRCAIFIATSEKQIKKLKEESSQAKDEQSRGKIVELIGHRKEEVSVIAGKYQALELESKQLEDKIEELRHAELLKGNLVD